MAESKKSGGTDQGWSAEERDAMKERAKEMRAQKGGKAKADGLTDLLAKISEMNDHDRLLAERLHTIILETAPGLTPKTWYGMPAYANEAGKVVVFFQNAGKFKVRYATLGFNEDAMLDDGTMWPISYAITSLTPAVEKNIADLVRRAVG